MNKYFRSSIDQVMQKKMDRGEFIKFALLGVIGLTGFATFIKSIPQSTRQVQQNNTKYGSGAYGGDLPSNRKP